MNNKQYYNIKEVSKLLNLNQRINSSSLKSLFSFTIEHDLICLDLSILCSNGYICKVFI